MDEKELEENSKDIYGKSKRKVKDETRPRKNNSPNTRLVGLVCETGNPYNKP
jgi:hypothetical protein